MSWHQIIEIILVGTSNWVSPYEGLGHGKRDFQEQLGLHVLFLRGIWPFCLPVTDGQASVRGASTWAPRFLTICLQVSEMLSQPLSEWVSEVTQLCPTLCDHMDCSLPGSSLHGILQARVLEWVAISFSRGSSRPRDWTWVFCIPGRCFNLWAIREAQPLRSCKSILFINLFPTSPIYTHLCVCVFYGLYFCGWTLTDTLWV